MKAKKTTLLSALICVAGILAEIIFRDVLSKSIAGVWLSVLLAAVILVLVYFVYDGVYSYVEAKQELESAHQQDREQKLYHLLNEQLQFQKAVIQEVSALKQANDKLVEEMTAQRKASGKLLGEMEAQRKTNDRLAEEMEAQRQAGDKLAEVLEVQREAGEKLAEVLETQSQTDSRLTEVLEAQSQAGGKLAEVLENQQQTDDMLAEELTAQRQESEKLSGQMAELLHKEPAMEPVSGQPQPVSAEIDQEPFDQVVALVNDHTMKAAKIIARYVNQNATEIKDLLKENHKEEQILLKDMESGQRTLLAIEEQKKQH